MKFRKFVSGIASALVVSASVASVLSVSAADNTVKISASKTNANPGSEFTIDVSLADIPKTGIQGMDFAVTYDSSLVSIQKVEAGPLTKTGASDSIDGLPAFGGSISKEKSAVLACFAVESSSDHKYYMQNEGVMFTITGKVLEDAKNGSVADFNIIATPRKANDKTDVDNGQIWVGYDANPGDIVSNFILYNTEIVNGSVTVGGGSASALKGDVNVDGSIDVADVVAIASYVGNAEGNPLGQQSIINGDVHNSGDGLTANDALLLQQYLAKIVTKL
ncbi:MAG: hypothetical protein K2G63_06730 [Oscillospiraceae bacterium]|nr:hypothetical protein [Oscillospiraceae bacterium]